MLPVLLMEPGSSSKRRRYSNILIEPRRRPHLSMDTIKERLKEVRDYSLAHLEALVDELTASLAACPEVEVTVARDAGQVVETIKRISDSTNIAINKSAVVAKELMPALVASGFDVIETYYGEFEPLEDRLGEYWQLPAMTFESLYESLEEPRDLTALRSGSIKKNGTRDLVGLLGVSAISSQEGAVLMLQHMGNISKVFEQARAIVLVASLDKVVKNLDDATFQTRCMASFGYEALAVELHGKTDRKVSIESLPFDNSPGQVAGKIHLILLDNGGRQILNSRYRELLACISCRACNNHCPPHLCDTPLTPNELLIDFKMDLLALDPAFLRSGGESQTFPKSANRELTRQAATPEHVWDCTTCRACHQVCPVSLELVEPVIDLRRDLVMERGVVPRTAERALRSIEDRGHPWRGTTLTRTQWAQGLGIETLAEDKNVDLLYWVGCTSALEDRSIRIAQAMARLFKLAGIRVGILGAEESCCGEPARRLGNEYLFRKVARKNIQLMKSYNVRRIATACPHCYTTLKNEYPKLGGSLR
ncbi:MAG: heterodisulfide reductase-related iron-sulfur binding cluster [Dehalococcoidia bacterium]